MESNYFLPQNPLESGIFCMTLSFSRYAYYEMVLDQKRDTFIRCHINAFKYLGGAPEIVRIDNLKAGVLEANFYEPIYQSEYVRFLKYYDVNPITCRIRKGQDKGKVESGVKYVKGNFLKGLETKEFEVMRNELIKWNEEVCNRRLYGTIKKVPLEQFKNIEQGRLKKLPDREYEIYKIGIYIVDNYGHIFFNDNFYSVPHEYKGKEIEIRSNGKVLRMYNTNYEEISMHEILVGKKGEFITIEEHKMDFKRAKDI